MKPHITFNRWAEANKGLLSQQDDKFNELVSFTRQYLKNVFTERHGVSHVIAAGMFDTLDRFHAELKARDIKGPKLKLPKVKIAAPTPYKRKGK